jgi:DNA-binding protein YbaB
MGIFDKMQQIKNIPGGISAVNKARKLQKEMSRQRIEAIENGVKVVMTGDFQIEELEIDGTKNERLREALNKTFKRIQKQMAQQMAANGDLGDLFKNFGK